MKKSPIGFGILLIFWWLVSSGSWAYGAGERIGHLTVSVEEGEIAISVELMRGFSHQVIRELQNGSPKDFYFYFLLKRRQTGWYDDELVSKTLRFTVRYDRLKEQYLVTRRDGSVVEELQLDNLESAEGLISKLRKVKIAPLSLLRPKSSYYVSVKAQMKAAKLPLYLDYFLFFIPFLELDTPWADSNTFNANSFHQATGRIP